MSQDIVLISGRAGHKTVVGYGRDMLVRPFIGYNQYNYTVAGIQISDPDSRARPDVWYMGNGATNIYSLWRTMKFVELTQRLDRELLEYAVTAFCRGQRNAQTAIELVVSTITEDRYLDLMRQVIPDDVATFGMFELKDDMANDPQAVTDEVLAGTLGMRSLFNEYGVRLDLSAGNRTLAEQDALLKLYPTLNSYREYMGFSPEDMHWHALEVSVCQAFERSLHPSANFDFDVVVGLAALRAQRNCRLPIHARADFDESEYAHEDMLNVLGWNSRTFRKDGFFGATWLGSYGAKNNLGKYDTLLSQLLTSWDAAPLVPLTTPN